MRRSANSVLHGRKNHSLRDRQKLSRAEKKDGGHDVLSEMNAPWSPAIVQGRAGRYLQRFAGYSWIRDRTERRFGPVEFAFGRCDQCFGTMKGRFGRRNFGFCLRKRRFGSQESEFCCRSDAPCCRSDAPCCRSGAPCCRNEKFYRRIVIADRRKHSFSCRNLSAGCRITCRSCRNARTTRRNTGQPCRMHLPHPSVHSASAVDTTTCTEKAQPERTCCNIELALLSLH